MALTVRFKITFLANASPVPTITWLDTSSYGALVAADHDILLWITDPNGISIYKNAGYDQNDFSSPDMVGNQSKTGILPILINSLITQGTYNFYCKIQDPAVGTTFTGSNSYDFEYIAPLVSISQSANIRTSELTSTDSTSYTVDAVAPSITRTHTITKPIGSGANDPGSTAAASRVVGGGATPATRLWTDEWQTSISTITSHAMETWDGSDWIIIEDTVTGNATIDVQAEDDINQIQTSLSALYGRWFTALTNNKKEADELAIVIMKLLTLWQEYIDAERNGGDYAIFSGAMADILNDEDYEASISGATEEIVPYGSGCGTCTANVITFVDSTPTGGNSGDMAIGNVGSGISWNVYYNNGGTWGLKGNLNAANAPILHSDLTDSNTSATVTEDILKTYTLPANTLDANNDYIDISALFHVTTGGLIDVTLKLYFGTEVAVTYNHTWMPNGYYVVKAKVFRIAVGSQKYESFANYWGSPDVILEHKFDNATEALGSNVIIKATSQKTTAGAVDIICKYLVVEHRKQS